MQKSDYFFIIKSFLIWLGFLFVILYFSQKFLPLQKDFLGILPFSNFDGEHYISIAGRGYGFGEHAFFPLYPMLISFLGKIFGSTLLSFNIAGILISLISFFLGLIGFFKLVKIDYSQKIVQLSLIFLLLFPTSFYFASVYTESLFFALAVWSIYFAREKKWLYAAILGIFSYRNPLCRLNYFPRSFC